MVFSHKGLSKCSSFAMGRRALDSYGAFSSPKYLLAVSSLEQRPSTSFRLSFYHTESSLDSNLSWSYSLRLQSYDLLSLIN
jgi:hypothetical protein